LPIFSEMDVRLQSKLLRAIQERVIDRVGGTKPVPVDIRIIATSNRNLADAVRDGTFREDLLFRLNVVNLKIPPLRERPADILELAQHFARKYAEANAVPLRPISTDARRVLTSNRWQGNVRELENTIHRSRLMAHADENGVEAILTPPAIIHAALRRLDQDSRHCHCEERSDNAIRFLAKFLDCFAEPVIGRAFAATRWPAMTFEFVGAR